LTAECSAWAEHLVTDIHSSEDYLALVARNTAELVDRLRLFPIKPREDFPAPACLLRLRAAALVLKGLELPACIDLGVTLRGMVEALSGSPGLDSRHLEPSLEMLASALEDFFAKIDAGQDLAGLADDPIWLAVLARLDTVGTPLEVMDELDLCARQWEERWGDQPLSEKVEQQLRERWSTYREYGDAVFGQEAEAGPEEPRAGRQASKELVLLLESRVRGEQLQDRLRGWGYRVHAVAGPEEAAGLLASHPSVRAVICDQTVSGRNLSALVARRRQEPQAFPELVLVTGGTGKPAVDLQRARSLGADRVWTEPFASDPLVD
jgi:CheY-like chemotaxis protein